MTTTDPDTPATDVLAQACTCDARYVKVEGAAGTGKTEAIVQRMAHLAASGVDPAGIVAFAATRTAATELARRAADCDGRLVQAQITTPGEFAVQMLASEDARGATGRVPRVLEDFEQRILVEDLKVIGIKPRRLREMLKFFYRTYSELADQQDDFLQTTEERMLADALSKHLQAREAMLRQELSKVAVTYLNTADPSCVWHFDHVLADDWQDYSFATQTMLDLLAQNQLFVCGNAAQVVPTTEDNPYPQGLAEMCQRHPDTVCFVLEHNLRSAPGIVDVGNALVRAAGEGAYEAAAAGEAKGPLRPVRVVQWTLPNAEFVGLADYIASRVAGELDPVHASQVFVAVPNALWGRAIAKVLADKGVKTSTILSYHALSGDPRDEAKCANLRLFTALNLASDPDDGAAWRNWCGFGDYLTHSNHWVRLEEYAREHGKGVAQALADIAHASGDEPFLGADVLARRYRSGRALVEGAEGKVGFSLINALLGDGSPGLPAGFAELVDPIEGTETAMQLFERARARAEVQFSNQDAVRIGLPHMAVGQCFDTVIVAGAVDGFFPSAQVFALETDDDVKRRLSDEQRRGWYVATQAACNTLVVSCFARDEAQTAANLGMQVHRIRATDGRRMASLSPSQFIDELGDAAPGFDTSL